MGFEEFFQQEGEGPESGGFVEGELLEGLLLVWCGLVAAELDGVGVV